ncbi:MAG: preprotein translocase subunit SecG [Clostridia bacterium]|nr:preprotein translocase subunit SecG [Clostridia bacterium]
MGTFEIIGSILLILSCLIMIVVVSLQSSKSQGLGALGGMTDDTVSGRNKAKTIDAMLAKVTKVVAIIMFALTFIVYAIDVFVK